MAMAPRAAGRVGDVSHAARAAARLARGMNWLETERRASLMRSRRALGPAPSALIWLGCVKPDTKTWVEKTERAAERERAARRERGERFALSWRLRLLGRLRALCS